MGKREGALEDTSMGVWHLWRRGGEKVDWVGRVSNLSTVLRNFLPGQWGESLNQSCLSQEYHVLCNGPGLVPPGSGFVMNVVLSAEEEHVGPLTDYVSAKGTLSCAFLSPQFGGPTLSYIMFLNLHVSTLSFLLHFINLFVSHSTLLSFKFALLF